MNSCASLALERVPCVKAAGLDLWLHACFERQQEEEEMSFQMLDEEKHDSIVR